MKEYYHNEPFYEKSNTSSLLILDWFSCFDIGGYFSQVQTSPEFCNVARIRLLLQRLRTAIFLVGIACQAHGRAMLLRRYIHAHRV